MFAPPRLIPGDTFNGIYKVLDFVGEGGMGVVYKVTALAGSGTLLEEARGPCALKILKAQDADSRERFKLEASVYRRTDQCPHIVRVYESGQDAQTKCWYVVMELLVGQNLQDMVARGGPLSPARVRKLLGQLAIGLDAAHRCEIVHRDLKPANLFVTNRGDDTEFLTIVDFGLAKQLRADRITRTGALGTYQYMAPEQLDTRKPPSPQTDIWALGLVTYFLLTGTSFWRAEHEPALMDEIRKPIGEPASARLRERYPNATLPAGFDAWLATCLQQDPNKRFRSAGKASSALGRVLESNRQDWFLPLVPVRLQPRQTGPAGLITTVSFSGPGRRDEPVGLKKGALGRLAFTVERMRAAMSRASRGRTAWGVVAASSILAAVGAPAVWPRASKPSVSSPRPPINAELTSLAERPRSPERVEQPLLAHTNALEVPRAPATADIAPRSVKPNKPEARGGQTRPSESSPAAKPAVVEPAIGTKPPIASEKPVTAASPAASDSPPNMTARPPSAPPAQPGAPAAEPSPRRLVPRNPLAP
jgi:eukaryotic-like serine/threonine-protein kinase